MEQISFPFFRLLSAERVPLFQVAFPFFWVSLLSFFSPWEDVLSLVWWLKKEKIHYLLFGAMIGYFFLISVLAEGEWSRFSRCFLSFGEDQLEGFHPSPLVLLFVVKDLLSLFVGASTVSFNA